MFIEELFDTAVNYFQHNIYVGLGILIVLSIFIINKTKDTIKFLVFVLALLLVIYIVSLAGRSMFTGVDKKDQMIHQTLRK